MGWENLAELFTRPSFPFLRQFLNSCFYAGMVALGVCFSCSLAAYSFACLRWRGRNIVFGLTVRALLSLPSVTSCQSIWDGPAGLDGSYSCRLSCPLFWATPSTSLCCASSSWHSARANGRRPLDGASKFRI